MSPTVKISYLYLAQHALQNNKISDAVSYFTSYITKHPQDKMISDILAPLVIQKRKVDKELQQYKDWLKLSALTEIANKSIRFSIMGHPGIHIGEMTNLPIKSVGINPSLNGSKRDKLCALISKMIGKTDILSLVNFNQECANRVSYHLAVALNTFFEPDAKKASHVHLKIKSHSILTHPPLISALEIALMKAKNDLDHVPRPQLEQELWLPYQDSIQRDIIKLPDRLIQVFHEKEEEFRLKTSHKRMTKSRNGSR